ncbi:MAG: hypothetical protein ACN0LA_14130 [Candidatus Longimicrobiales bacterium M2_2A_002]
MASASYRYPAPTDGRPPPGARRRLASLAACAIGLAALGATGVVVGGGDPTTPYLTGFGNPCRMAFDGGGALYINDIDTDTFYRVPPGGAPTVFTDAVPGAAGFTIDAFGDILAASPADSAVLRISPQAEVTVFAHVFNARAVAIGPDGGVWVSAVDSVHHFDPVGRLLESVDVRSQGAAAFGVGFGPSGELHFSNSAGLWKLSSGVPVPILTEQPVFNRGFAIDADGRIYWGRDAGEGDTDRVILYDGAGTVIDDTMIAGVVDPCLVLFVRDTDGTTTRRVLISQLDGAIVEANTEGIPAAGWPATPISLAGIPELDCASQAAGADVLSNDVIRFLDAIGNANGGYDVGDFRAYLLATGAVAADLRAGGAP